MTTKPLDRLMFSQGHMCFFCRKPLPKAEASVEHLFASANGGTNGDDNCVACCKSINALLGSMSLKEKFQVVLNQKGLFKCPNEAGRQKSREQASPLAPSKPAIRLNQAPKRAAPSDAKKDKLTLIIDNLKQRGKAKPGKLVTLTRTIAALFPDGIEQTELNALVQQLQSTGKVKVTDNLVTYEL